MEAYGVIRERTRSVWGAYESAKASPGRIGFVSGGDLPPPMRLLPEPALKSASDVICKTVSDFAIASFQKGARAKYQEFLLARQKEKTASGTK